MALGMTYECPKNNYFSLKNFQKANESPETSLSNDTQLRNKLEEILKLMLVVWCRENQALKLVATPTNGNLFIIFSSNLGQGLTQLIK